MERYEKGSTYEEDERQEEKSVEQTKDEMKSASEEADQSVQNAEEEKQQGNETEMNSCAVDTESSEEEQFCSVQL